MNQTQRTTTPIEQQVLGYLDTLSKNDEIDMLTSAPLVQDRFGLDMKNCIFMVKVWLKNSNPQGDYALIEIPKVGTIN